MFDIFRKMQQGVKRTRDVWFGKVVGLFDRATVGEELWEVKSGDRHFRQTDIRQVLTYCALNYASRTRVIDRFSLVNPRAGVIACGTVDDLARAVAASDPQALFEEIVAFLSFQDASV